MYTVLNVVFRKRRASLLRGPNNLLYVFVHSFVPIYLLLCILYATEVKSSHIQPYTHPQPKAFLSEASPLSLRLEAEKVVNHDDIQSRVFRGRMASGSYTFMAAIMQITKEEPSLKLLGLLSSTPKAEKAGLLCGCSLISNQYVLTAAHCVTAMQQMVAEGKTMEVWPGIHDISTIPDESHRFPIKEAYTADYDQDKSFLNDVAILKLAQPVTFSKNVSRCCIGTGDYDNKDVVLAGFGLQDCKHMSNKLREARGVARSFERCGPLTSRLHSDQICATFTNDDDEMADQAPGDSGGPLFAPSETDANTYELIGTVSFNMVDPSTKCPEEKSPSVFQRTAAHRSFITEHVPDAKFC